MKTLLKTIFIDDFNTFNTNCWRKLNEVFHGENKNIEPKL